MSPARIGARFDCDPAPLVQVVLMGLADEVPLQPPSPRSTRAADEIAPVARDAATSTNGAGGSVVRGPPRQRSYPDRCPHNGIVRITYDRAANAAYIYLTERQLESGRDTVVADLPPSAAGFVALDWKDGRLVGIEVLEASRTLHQDLLDTAERI